MYLKGETGKDIYIHGELADVYETWVNYHKPETSVGRAWVPRGQRSSRRNCMLASYHVFWDKKRFYECWGFYPREIQ